MISIITPTFNSASQIAGCLENVIDQRCVNLEHIIVDGASCDGTTGILNNYASRHRHIRWISEPDTGQSNAMNKGVEMARGEIIGVLNSDDRYEPGTLNRVISIFTHLPSPALVVGNCNQWDDAHQLVTVNRPKNLSVFALTLGPCLVHFPVNPVSYFCHRSLFHKMGGFDESLHLELDWDFILRAVQAAHTYYYDEIWGNYYMLAGTKTVLDLNSGQGIQRQKAILSKYRRCLPWTQRIASEILYTFFNNFLGCAFFYFIRHPYELPMSLFKKIHG